MTATRDRGVWRALGQGADGHREHRTTGYEHLEVIIIIDDTSRFAVVVPVPDESGASAPWHSPIDTVNNVSGEHS